MANSVRRQVKAKLSCHSFTEDLIKRLGPNRPRTGLGNEKEHGLRDSLTVDSNWLNGTDYGIVMDRLLRNPELPPQFARSDENQKVSTTSTTVRT